MGGTGPEINADSSGNIAFPEQGGAESGALPSGGDDLDEVVASWAMLSDDDREQILEIVRAAISCDDGLR